MMPGSITVDDNDQSLFNQLASALKQPGVDPHRIYVLGHSEGTQVAIDVAALDSRVKGILLLGYVGVDLATIFGWQLYRRSIDFFVATDVDTNKDGFVDRIAADNNPDFSWSWLPERQKVFYNDLGSR